MQIKISLFDINLPRPLVPKCVMYLPYMFSWSIFNPLSVDNKLELEVRIGTEVINKLVRLLCKHMKTNVTVGRLQSDKWRAPTLVKISELTSYEASELLSHLSYLLQGSCPPIRTSMMYMGQQLDQSEVVKILTTKVLLFDNVLKVDFE